MQRSYLVNFWVLSPVCVKIINVSYFHNKRQDFYLKVAQILHFMKPCQPANRKSCQDVGILASLEVSHLRTSITHTLHITTVSTTLYLFLAYFYVTQLNNHSALIQSQLICKPHWRQNQVISAAIDHVTEQRHTLGKLGMTRPLRMRTKQCPSWPRLASQPCGYWQATFALSGALDVDFNMARLWTDWSAVILCVATVSWKDLQER